MSKTNSSVITRTNNLINSHKVASSIIAGGLLASVAFVSAAAISLSGQLAKDAYSYPITSYHMATDKQDKQNEQPATETTPESQDEQGQSGQVQGASSTNAASTNTVASAKATTPAPAPVQTINVVNTPAPAAPINPVQPVNPQPVEQPPVAPAFTVSAVRLQHTESRQTPYNGQLMNTVSASIELHYENGYNATGKSFSYSTVALTGDYLCETYEDKGMKVHIAIPEANAYGTYTCRVTVSDGTVSRSTDFHFEHTAPVVDPQPANGYEFLFNMPVMATIDGLNIYTSKFNYAAFPGCDDNTPYVCESTASIAFDVRASGGLTIPNIHETVVSEDTPGLTCKIDMSPSYANNGYGIITLQARNNVEDGLYVCEFALVENDPASYGVLIVELVDGKFRSITEQQLDDLLTEIL